MFFSFIFIVFGTINASFSNELELKGDAFQELSDSLDLTESELEELLLMMGSDPTILIKQKIKEGEVEDLMNLMVAQFQQADEQELFAFLQSFFESQENPLLRRAGSSNRFVFFLTKLLQDKKAIPKLVSIVEDHRRLLYFFIANILIFVFGFYYRRRDRRKNPKNLILISLRNGFKRFFILITLRVFVLFAFFQSEITPFLSIVWQYGLRP